MNRQTSPRSERPLRSVLLQATEDRDRMVRNGWSRRKDIDRLRAAIGRATVFLNAYPYADDERVRHWCLAHHEDVAMIVPGNNPRALARLVMRSLKPKHEARVIELFPSNPAA